LSSATVFERTWEAAIHLCLTGEVQGQAFLAGTAPEAGGAAGRRWAVLDRKGQILFTPPLREDEPQGLFAVARRFAELEDAHARGVEPPPYTEDPRRTHWDSLREWGLLDDNNNVLSPFETDPEPLLGYVVRVGNVYAYGVVKQSTLQAGTITPTGACESADEARRRASELLMLALVRGATVMGMNGVPAVIDLSSEVEDS
jgi:hypothetical protein